MNDLQPVLQVPDTLDLASHAKTALNYFIASPDPEARYQPHFVANLEADPPYLEHNEWDFGDVSWRFIESIALIRAMTGEVAGAEVEAGLKELAVSFIDPDDGLLYRPQSAYNSYPLAASGGRAGAYVWDQRVLYALLAWHMTGRDSSAAGLLERLVAGLARVVTYRDNYCYFPSECYVGGGKWCDFPMMWLPDGQLIDPLVRYYEVSGDPASLELARKLGRAVLTREPHAFGPEGEMLRDGHNTHFHSRTSGIAGLAHLAIATGDSDLLGFTEKAYCAARAYSSTFGWVPEQLKTIRWSETCSICDMINVAVQFAEAGLTSYWSDVERFVRNCLVESQILSVEMLPRPWRTVPETIPGSRTYYNVAQRVVGGFVGSVFPNDRHFLADWHDGFGISGCCSPGGTKALYLAWSHIVTRSGDDTRVNLMLSADTPWATVVSHHPYRGRVEIVVKDGPRLWVRVPDWADRGRAGLTVNGQARSLRWEGDGVRLCELVAGDRVVLDYPMVTREAVERVAGQDYQVRWRGDTIVNIDPPGERMPLYQRREMERDDAPVKAAGTPAEPSQELYHLW